MSVGVELNGYTLTRQWYNFRFENPNKAKHVHSDLYFYIIDRWNRFGQKEIFTIPTATTMEALGIGSYNTYKTALHDLIEFGFIEVIEWSRNQHYSTVIALSKNDKAIYKALDKASDKADDKAIDKAFQSYINNRIREQENEGIDDIPASLPTKNKRQVKAKATKENLPPPTLDEVVEYFKANGYKRSAAEKFHDYYTTYAEDNGGVWADKNGNAVKNWKLKAKHVWFKEENEEKATDNMPLQMQVLINAAQAQNKVIIQAGKITDYSKVWVYFYIDKATNKSSVLYGESEHVKKRKEEIELTGKSWHLYCSDIFNRNPLMKVEV